jgi:molecular chaperone GrpE
MGMDELEDAKGEGESNSTPPSTPPANEEEERNSRVDAAKAFFRAMYAGEEPPASFGQPQEQPKAEASTSTACRNCESMEFALKEAEAKANESDTLYKRMAADFDNYRRRMERQGEESVALGVKKAAEALVPALDDLDRAMLYLNPNLPAEKVIESFKLVGNRILSCMETIGLKPIVAVGELFDPKFHEPVQQIETNEFADGVVMSELRRGYMLHDRVVRPALVNVASNSTGVVVPRADAGAGETAAAAPAPAEPAPAPAPTEAEAPPVEAAPEPPPPAEASKPGPSAETIEASQPAVEAGPEVSVVDVVDGEETTTKVYDLGDVPDV